MFRRSLPKALRRGGTGLVSFAYTGNSAVRPESATLRAGRHAAALRLTAAHIDGSSFLVATGTVAARVTGRLLVRVTYVAADGQPVGLDYRPVVRSGRWRVEERLPDAAASSGGALTVRYTGSARSAIRGEQRAAGLRGLADGAAGAR